MQNTEIAHRLNDIRVQLVKNRRCKAILDYGIGSGEFLDRWRRAGHNHVGYGYDICEVAVQLLKASDAYKDPAVETVAVDGWTMWDVLEHLPQPEEVLDRIPRGKYLFLALPIFADLQKVRFSKHYRPNEHLYYFTADGLVTFMADCDFRLLECTDAETTAGREEIMSFVFQKC